MKSALLSKIAMCVCPPAIVATTAVTVPPVKRAVHRLTAPAHAPARPKPRHVFSAAYDCTPTAVPISNAPSAMTAVAPTDATGATPEAPPTALSVRPADATGGGYSPIALNPGPFAGPLYPIGTPETPGTTTPVTPVIPVTPAVLPEISTWAMTITGFGAIGWALRRKPRSVEAKIEAV